MASPDRWRGLRRSASADRYLHALLLLTDHGRPADTGEVARLVGVSPAAVSAMLKRLSQPRLVHLQQYLSRVGRGAGGAIAVKAGAHFEGPISVRVGGKVRHLGRHLATMIRVSPERR